MLDKLLEVAYRAEQKKTASRQLVDKLKGFPVAELAKLAAGDETCKLAYALDCVKGDGTGGDGTWIGKYKGTPLFAQAIELEKQLIQIDMEEQQARAAQPPMNDAWQKRDAIRLQQRMLDLDLAMAGSGIEPPAAAPPSAEELSTADAPELALEQGGPPKAPKAPKGPPPGAAGEPSEEELLAALEQEGGGPETVEGAPKPPSVEAPQPPAPPKPKAPPQAQAQEGEEEEETEEGQPPKKDDKPKGMSVEVKQSSVRKIASVMRAGSFLAKVASGEAKLKKEITKKHPGLAKESAAPLLSGTSYIPEVLGAAAGANKGSESNQPGSAALRGALGAGGGAFLGEHAGRALAGGNPAAGALGAVAGGLAGYKALTSKYNKPAPISGDGEYNDMSPEETQQYAAEHDQAAADVDANPGKYRAHRAILGGLAGAGPGALVGAAHGRPGVGALVGGLGGAALAALPKPSGNSLREEADAARAHLKMAMAGALGGIAGAAKGLAQSAHAAGGLPQVAKSFGGVAKGFAQKNPLTAAGIAGAGGLMAGKAMSPGQPRA